MRRRSIRFKLALWFCVILILAVLLTFAVVRVTSGMVLRGTIRDYLISTVEENVDKIQYVQRKSDNLTNIYLPYEDGYLEIDEDFLDVVNDVHSGLYLSDGTMLYGENPLSRQTDAFGFAGSLTWHMNVDGVRYDLYDRKLNMDLPGEKTIWIRGIVPDTKTAAQLGQITHISLILLPVLIVIAALSGYLLSDRLLSPLRKIEAATQSISQGDDLKRRIEPGKNDDEVGRLAKVFNGMLDRLEHSFEVERQFTSDASHELRTPLSVILAQCEYTLEKPRQSEEYEKALQVVHKQGRRMSALVGDMLDYTRMEQGIERYPMEPVNLSELTEETAQPLSLLRENNITLTWQLEGEIHIVGNRMLLSRLLQNLISNAYRYGRENGVTEITLRRDGDRAVLSVRDNGIGIAQKDREKIFDRFYRADAARSAQGSGLGLAMVKRIAQLHNAPLELDSEIGVGSTFLLYFPIYEPL